MTRGIHMGLTDCPGCDRSFDTTGDTRQHAWERHSACHYCGAELAGETHSALYKHWLVAHPKQLSRVDRERATATVGSLSIRDRWAHGGLDTAVKSLPRRYVLIAGGSTAAAGLAIGGAILTRNGTTREVGQTAGGDYSLPVIGSADAGTTITYFGNYKCPYCAQFSTGLLADIREEYVEPGDLAIRYRHLSYFNGQPFLGPDAVTAGHADLAVFNVAPQSYWDFHHYTYSHQGPERRRWATADTLVEYASRAGVSETSPIRTAIQGSRYTDALRDSDQAAQHAGVTGTPTLLIQGTAFNPSADPAKTRRLIEEAIARD